MIISIMTTRLRSLKPVRRRHSSKPSSALLRDVRIIDELSARLIVEFGKGFNRTNLFNMVRFAEVFPDAKIVHSLSGQLTWTHLRILIYLEKPLQREFYAAMCADQRWSVRELQRQIQGMLYERIALSKKPDAVVDQCIRTLRETGEMTPEMVFLDHVNLSALGLRDDLASERDLENAMLFYNRRLRALVAVDLKLGKFEPAHFGQMELYLRWLEKHEMLPGESRPYGLVLCAGSSQERLELLRLGEHGIHVAEYMTELPPQDLLKAQLHEAIERARERVAIRQSEAARETAA